MAFGNGREAKVVGPFASAIALVCASAVQAQTTAENSADSLSTIIVRGDRTTLEIRPDEIFTEEDISFYGFDSVGEVVDEITSREGRSQDDVIFLVDGQRVSGLNDVADFPAEAIDRLELFPQGSATEVGGSANQRIVNIRLKSATSIYITNKKLAAATEGGFVRYDGEFSFTQIQGRRRLNLGVQLRGNGALLESERDITQISAAPSTLGDFRTLIPGNNEIMMRGTFADALSPNLNALVGTRFLQRNTDALLGIGGSGEALTQNNQLTSLNTNALVTGQFDEWLVTGNASYGVTRRRTLTDDIGAAPGISSRQRPVTAILQRIAGDLNVTRPVVQLPAGPLTLTLRGRFSGESVEAGGTEFSQSLRQLGGGIAIPLTHNDRGPLKGIGTIDLGIDASLSDYSGIENLSNSLFSVNWRPTEWLRVSGSLSTGQTPPSAELLSAPLITTPGTRYFDPLFNETVDVVSLTGGDPDLLTQDDKNRRIAIEIRPLNSRLLAFTVDYTSLRNRNIITAAPPANTLFLDAFPERFNRDAAGRLLRVDIRPLNFSRKSEERVRYAFELSFLLGGKEGLANPEIDAEQPKKIVIPQRLQFLFSHAIVLNSDIVVASGFEAIDLLSPSALGLGGGGRSRHEIDFTARYGARGIGAELNARHISAGFINAVDERGAEALRFSALSTADLRFFIEGRRIASEERFLNGMRFTLAVRNILNGRQSVRNSFGETPLLYQPAYRDPTGRLIEVSLRKRF